MIDLLKRVPHDTESSEMKEFLERVQGNILRGHGRDHAIHIFVRFTKSQEELRAALIPLSKSFVTSAWAQLDQAREFRESGKSAHVFGNLLLSATGYQALGFPPEMFDQQVDRFFRDGMRSEWSRARLGDPDLASWDEAFRERVDMLLILAGDDLQELGRATQSAMSELEKIGVPTAERGEALWNADRSQSLEPFGFVDGVSQPLFFEKDVKSTEPYNPVAPLALVLIQDPNVRDQQACGSFYVFRKLEQNVRGFRESERALAEALNVPVQSVEAGVVGRFRDGTPLELSKLSKPELAGANNFRFGGAEGCPLHAHMRKANPRRAASPGSGQQSQGTQDDDRRIARRGIPYDHRPKPVDANASFPETQVGLLFSCFQANIDRQFAFIQRVWLNDADFEAVGTGEDPLVSHGERGGPQQWRNAAGEAKSHHFGRFVTMRGGEFFFAPSIPFLSKLTPG
jgi:Dyp-type peroxidase family